MSHPGSDSLVKAQARRVSTKQFGMLMTLVSLGVLFAATIVAYLVTRFSHPAWDRAEVGVPGGTLLASVLLVLLSLSLEAGLKAIRRNQQQKLLRRLQLSAALGVVFLTAQTYNWWQIKELASETSELLSLFTFYLLTGVHALHVLGGLIPLAIVYNRAVEREYSSSRYEGLRFLVQYWHFLLVVWVLLVATMFMS